MSALKLGSEYAQAVERQLVIFQRPGFPQLANVTFDVEWSGILDRQHIRNEAMNFEGEFLQTSSTILWSSVNPSGFQFTSEARNPTALVYAVIGHERSGVFFE